MGVYNTENTMTEAVKSIVNQTREDWEFVICDDGSSDNTYNEILYLSERDSRFIIIKNDRNMGLPYTLNHCIEKCRGEYIARMDADDLSYPERFEKQIKFLENHSDISFVSSCVDLFDGEKITSVRMLPEFPTKRQMIYGSQFIHPATMFKSDALRAVGGYRVSEETRRGQDYDLFMRMYGMGMRGANLQIPVYRYTEDAQTFKRRSFKARVGEYKIRRRGYKEMGVYPWAFPFVFKPFAAHFVQKLKTGKG